MITREDIRELAQFHTNSDESCALSFYFEPRTPQNKSHREEAILAKDLVRKALQDAGKNGKNGCGSDLKRVLELAENLHGNQARAKAVFACNNQNFWREFDLPAQHAGTQLFLNRQFQLRPLAALLGAQPSLCVVLLDRHRARIFDLRLDQLTEREDLARIRPYREGHSDGFAGYDGGHAQRRIEDDVLHHFRDLAERLRSDAERGIFEALIVACQEVNWHDFEAELHPPVKKLVLGHFSPDGATPSNEEIREQATRILQQAQDRRRGELVKEALDQAKANSRGVTGLRRTLRSLEMGEVQTLLIGDNFLEPATQCDNCGHLSPGVSPECSACGKPARQFADAGDIIIPLAIRRNIELFYVKNDPEFENAGNIAALLRFRADQRKNAELRAAS